MRETGYKLSEKILSSVRKVFIYQRLVLSYDREVMNNDGFVLGFQWFLSFIGDSKIVGQLLINENQYCEIIHQLGELFIDLWIPTVLISRDMHYISPQLLLRINQSWMTNMCYSVWFFFRVIIKNDYNRPSFIFVRPAEETSRLGRLRIKHV